MSRRTLLLVTLVAAIIVIPTLTAPVPGKKPVKEFTNSIGMKLVRIEPGTFKMGSFAAEKDDRGDSRPHHVDITKAFHIGVYTVTQAEYEKVMGNNPSYFSVTGKGKDKVKGLDTSKFPVECVNWKDASKFCEKFSGLAKEKEAGRKYRLPTEAEWEYACRAGTRTRYHSGDDKEDLNNVGWYSANSGDRTHTVGKKKPNAWGLYDMHGNVYQWCSDWYGKDYYDRSNKKDPQGPKSGEVRIMRGGCWNVYHGFSEVSMRVYHDPDDRIQVIGFRVVCVPIGK